MSALAALWQFDGARSRRKFDNKSIHVYTYIIISIFLDISYEDDLRPKAIFTDIAASKRSSTPNFVSLPRRNAPQIQVGFCRLYSAVENHFLGPYVS